MEASGDELLDLHKYYRKMEATVQGVRGGIFRLAQQAPDLETMHWYMWLDECFENDSFELDSFGVMQWRSWVLQQKGEPIGKLLNMITPILQEAGLVSSDGKVIDREAKPDEAN